MTTSGERRSDALVLDGRSRGSLAVARSLGRDGYAVAVATKGRPTRYAREHVDLPPIASDTDRFVRELVAWLERHGADVVLTSTDGGVSTLSEARDRIERTSAVALATSEALSVATSKSETLVRARAVGIPTPRTLLVDRPEDVTAAVDEIGLPCVLKPDRSWSGRRTHNERERSVFLSDSGEAHRAADRLSRPGARALIQEFASGARGAIMLFRASGRVSASFAMSVTRTWPPLGGNSVMRTSVRPPEDCLRYAQLLAAELDLDGYSEVEFRRAPDGRPLLMEVNARFSQSIELALRAGVDFAKMQVEWARGGRVPEADGYRVGVRLSWFEAELFLVAASVLRRPLPAPALRATIRDLVEDYVPPPKLDGFLADDPVPAVSQVRASLMEFLREVRDARAPARHGSAEPPEADAEARR